jgi:transcriptional regulator with XRE-family HTH domain
MTETGRPTVLGRTLGTELRWLRNAAELTIQQVAKALDCSPSKISRMETAQVGASPRDVSAPAELYGCDQEQRDRLVQLARDARAASATGWWHDYGDVPSARSRYSRLEAAADRIHSYEGLLVPGLLQTPDYARAVIRAVQPRHRPLSGAGPSGAPVRARVPAPRALGARSQRLPHPDRRAPRPALAPPPRQGIVLPVRRRHDNLRPRRVHRHGAVRGGAMQHPGRAQWRKSTRSGLSNCVEVAFLGGLHVAVRDSKDQRGPVLTFTVAEWRAFLDGIRGGVFERP